MPSGPLVKLACFQAMHNAMAITESGLGLMCVGIGIVAQIGAATLTPSDVQAWVSRSYLGIDGPLGPGYNKFWKNHPTAMIFFHVMFPLFLPMFLLWGLFNWLSYKTAIPTQWPQEVLDAIGPGIDLS